MVKIEDRLISLWPRTWEQQHNRVRLVTIEHVASELTGDNWQRYNAIMDSIEAQDYGAFFELIYQR